jgi:hypothetical protein
MNTSSSIDEILNEMNDRAKVEGRYLGKAFWEIPSQPNSILAVPLTPEAELRIAALRARRLQRRQKAAEEPEPATPRQDAEEHVHDKITPGISAGSK